MAFSISRGPRPLLAVFLALVAAASGCSSSDEGSRQAANLGTRICILNSWTEKVTVQYTAKDTSTREGNLSPGEQSCAEGTTLFSPRNDVDGILVLPEPARAFFFYVVNQFIGTPLAGLSQFAESVPRTSRPDPYTVCLSRTDGFNVGETRPWDNGVMRVSIKRLPDDQWKEFVLVIEPSQGQRVGNDPCPDGG